MVDATVLDFPILGRRFHAAGLPCALADWLRAHWYFPEHAVAAHDYPITLQVRDTPPAAPPGSGAVAVTVQGIVLTWRPTDAVWWLDVPDGGLRLTLAPSAS